MRNFIVLVHDKRDIDERDIVERDIVERDIVNGNLNLNRGIGSLFDCNIIHLFMDIYLDKLLFVDNNRSNSSGVVVPDGFDGWNFLL